METARRENFISESASTCGIFKKRKKNKFLNSLTDEEIYEPVVQQRSSKSVERRALLLIGAHCVGRRSIKKTLVDFDKRFAYPKPYTDRPMSPTGSDEDSVGEDSMSIYYHVSHEEMMEAIKRGEYLEHGRHEGYIFGTKFDTIDRIIQQGYIPVLDVEAESVKKLRCAKYSPYVVFVGAPTHFPSSNDEEFIRSLSAMVRESAELENTYKAFFDLKVENRDIEQTVQTIRINFDRSNSPNSAEWIPQAWVKESKASQKPIINHLS